MTKPLLELARKAKPLVGRMDVQQHLGNPKYNRVTGIMVGRLPECEGGNEYMREPVAAYIAACSPERIIALCERQKLLEEFVEAFTIWHDHPNVEHHSYETAHSDMITKWRKVIGR